MSEERSLCQSHQVVSSYRTGQIRQTQGPTYPPPRPSNHLSDAKRFVRVWWGNPVLYAPPISSAAGPLWDGFLLAKPERQWCWNERALTHPARKNGEHTLISLAAGILYRGKQTRFFWFSRHPRHPHPSGLPAPILRGALAGVLVQCSSPWWSSFLMILLLIFPSSSKHDWLP